MTDERFEQKRDKLCELFHESDGIAEKWQSIVEEYVEGSEGLHPWNSEDKEKDAKGRLINIRTFDGDDNFAADYFDFEDEFLLWSGSVQEVMRELPPRFRARFEQDAKKSDRFSAQYDKKYNFVGDVPDLLDLYDDFHKEREALRWAEFWTNDVQRNIKKDEDVAFELAYNEMKGELRLNGYLVKRCQLYSTLDSALRAALANEKHEAKAPSKIKQGISAIHIPVVLRGEMLSTGGGMIRMKPRITYGELKQLGLDETKITEELQEISLEKVHDSSR